jgi:hypothetical protein
VTKPRGVDTGTAFMCAALSGQHSIRSARQWNTGFQYSLQPVVTRRAPPRRRILRADERRAMGWAAVDCT